MNSLYGNIISHTPRSRFDISKVYPNRTEMERAQSVDEGDGVPLFGYVLIDYNEKPTIFEEEPPKEYYYNYNNSIDQETYEVSTQFWTDYYQYYDIAPVGNVLYQKDTFYYYNDEGQLILSSDDRFYSDIKYYDADGNRVYPTTKYFLYEPYKFYTMNKETGYPEFIIDEEFNPEYLYHYAKYSITPYKINYDKTVWQKQNFDGKFKYIAIDRLNSIFPTFHDANAFPLIDNNNPSVPQFGDAILLGQYFSYDDESKTLFDLKYKNQPIIETKFVLNTHLQKVPVGNELYEPNKFYIKNDNNEYILTDTPFDENTIYYIKENDRYERAYPTIEEYLYVQNKYYIEVEHYSTPTSFSSEQTYYTYNEEYLKYIPVKNMTESTFNQGLVALYIKDIPTYELSSSKLFEPEANYYIKIEPINNENITELDTVDGIIQLYKTRVSPKLQLTSIEDDSAIDESDFIVKRWYPEVLLKDIDNVQEELNKLKLQYINSKENNDQLLSNNHQLCDDQQIILENNKNLFKANFPDIQNLLPRDEENLTGWITIQLEEYNNSWNKIYQLIEDSHNEINNQTNLINNTYSPTIEFNRSKINQDKDDIKNQIEVLKAIDTKVNTTKDTLNVTITNSLEQLNNNLIGINNTLSNTISTSLNLIQNNLENIDKQDFNNYKNNINSYKNSINENKELINNYSTSLRELNTICSNNIQTIENNLNTISNEYDNIFVQKNNIIDTAYNKGYQNAANDLQTTVNNNSGWSTSIKNALISLINSWKTPKTYSNKNNSTIETSLTNITTSKVNIETAKNSLNTNIVELQNNYLNPISDKCDVIIDIINNQINTEITNNINTKISYLVDTRIPSITQEITNINNGISNTKNQISNIKTEIINIKTEITNLNNYSNEIKDVINELNDNYLADILNCISIIQENIDNINASNQIKEQEINSIEDNCALMKNIIQNYQQESKIYIEEQIKIIQQNIDDIQRILRKIQNLMKQDGYFIQAQFKIDQAIEYYNQMEQWSENELIPRVTQQYYDNMPRTLLYNTETIEYPTY